MRHIVIFPYYCSAEVDRFLWLLQLFKDFPKPESEVEFLLVSGTAIESNKELEKQASRFAPTSTFSCQQYGEGHLLGAAGMFWQAMDFIQQEHQNDGGFALWMESDMAPVKPDWIDRLDRQWCSFPEPLVMGQFVDRLPEHIGSGSLDPHINGGACYSKELSEFVPDPESRKPPFDVSLYNSLNHLSQRVHATSLFAFSAEPLISVMRDNQEIAVLHGLAQPKDQFLRAAIGVLAPQIKCPVFNSPMYDLATEIALGRTFLDIYRSDFKPRLSGLLLSREDNFEKMFEYLEGLNKDQTLIVETGCTRQDSWIDGRGTILFDSFVRARGGEVVSVDLSASNCQYAREHTSDSTSVTQEDSVSFLARFSREIETPIDLLYLDSYDLDWDDIHSSALHHLMELCAVMPALHSGTLVVVDDHCSKIQPGKSLYVLPWMERIGAKELFDGYQIGWILP